MTEPADALHSEAAKLVPASCRDTLPSTVFRLTDTTAYLVAQNAELQPGMFYLFLLSAFANPPLHDEHDVILIRTGAIASQK